MIQLRVAFLIVGYFQRTITIAEQTELDVWLADSQKNQQVFEECLELALRPKIRNEIDFEDEDLYIRIDKSGKSGYHAHIAGLLFKKFNDSISQSEKAELDNWKFSSEQNHHLYNGLAGSTDLNALFEWVITRYWSDHPKNR